MRRPSVALLALLAAVVALAAWAGTASARTETDIYIFGTVAGKAAGKNAARVVIRWDFKCLGDKLGEATYEYTLVASTLGEEPARKATFTAGTSKRGTLTALLAPGRWQLRGDPFLCETERGAGSTTAEVGQVVTVPDYCAWTPTSVRGAVEVGTGASVRRARSGVSVSPPATISTPARAAASLTTPGREASVSAGPSTSLQLVRGACGGGPSMTLASGSVTVAASPVTTTELRTGAARVRGRAATWSTTIGPGTITVTVARGSVSVQGRAGAPVQVRAGFRTVVAGRGGPSPPTRK